MNCRQKILTTIYGSLAALFIGSLLLISNNANAQACTSSAQCTAGGACKIGNCMITNILNNSGTCVYMNTPNGSPCVDTNLCLTGDSCQNGACVGGTTPANCDDRNICTTDSCDTATGCKHIANNTVTQSCSTGQLGVCGAGTKTCSAGAFGSCVRNVGPSAEVCDGKDNDCDGVIDDGVTKSCSTGELGVCSAGTQTCSAGSFGSCVRNMGRSAETCDGLDNNCNGLIDDGVTQSCSTGQSGACSVGTQTCSAGAFGSCVRNTNPTSEICDGIDNNCNGLIDDGIAPQVCTSSNSFGICSGTKTCSGGAFGTCNAKTPSAEICDGLDNDCDGQIDEGVKNSCGTCGPAPTEICDGIDNNCNGQTDEGFANLGQTCSSGIGECKATGVFVCAVDHTGTQCSATPKSPTTEICDGLDNNCDGAIDENFVDKGTTCSNGVGDCKRNGIMACKIDGTGTQCNATTGLPSPEQCDSQDNDCDGVVDNGFNIGQSCREGDIQCGGNGTLQCDDAISTICSNPQLKVDSTQCNDGDICTSSDSCSGGRCSSGTPVPDRSCYTGAVGTDGIGTCHGGTQSCASNAWGVCVNEVTPIPEICGNNADDDCDGVVDNGCCGNGTREGSEVCDDGIISNGQPNKCSLKCDGLTAPVCSNGIIESGEQCDEGALNGTTGHCTNFCTIPNCDDTNICTDDSYSQTQGCVYVDNALLCDDHNNCTVSDRCANRTCSGIPDSRIDTACDPGKGLCMTGTYQCSNNSVQCVASNLPDNTPCSDGKICNGEEKCQSGTCQAGTALVCDDHNDCTDDSCDAITGCQNTNVADGAPVAGEKICGGGVPVFCLAGQTQVCGTGQPGACSTGTQSCVNGNWDACIATNSPTAEICDGLDNDCNGSADDHIASASCNTGQQGVCSAGTTSCQNGTTVCNQTTLSSAELCDGIDNDCDGQTDEGFNLGSACTVGGSGCANSGVIQCQADGTSACSVSYKLDGTSCRDDNACNGNEVCKSGSCQPGISVLCTVSDSCHEIGTCDPQNGICSNPEKPVGTPLADGRFCGGGGIILTCMPGTTKPCSSTNAYGSCDGIITCDANGNWGSTCSAPQANACGMCGGNVITNLGGDCSVINSDFCNEPGSYVCNETGQNTFCKSSGAVSKNICGVCGAPNPDKFGQSCSSTGEEQCRGAGSYVCDASNSSGPAVCNAKPKTGSSCNDGNGCTGGESCQADGSCGSGSAVADDTQVMINGVLNFCRGGFPNICPAGVEDDHNVCTRDACLPLTGQIVRTPVNKPTGDACNTVSNSCDPVNGWTTTPVAKPTVKACQTVSDSCDSVQGWVISDKSAPAPDKCQVAGTQTCDPNTGAWSFAAVDPNDGNACTTDSCDPNSGVKNEQLASIGQRCDTTQNDCPQQGTNSCDPQTGAITCDVTNPQSQNACSVCGAPNPDKFGQSCSSTGEEQCRGAGSYVCDASNSSGPAVCNAQPKTGSVCDDGNACTSGETCNANGSCESGSAVAEDTQVMINGVLNFCRGGFPNICPAGVEDDHNVCTRDACLPLTGQIVRTPVNKPTGDACNTVSNSCDPVNGWTTTPVAKPTVKACQTVSDSCDSVQGWAVTPVAKPEANNCQTVSNSCDPDQGWTFSEKPKPSAGSCDEPDSLNCGDNNEWVFTRQKQPPQLAEHEIWDPKTCQIILLAYCGDGKVDPDIGEQCEGEAVPGEHQACINCKAVNLTYCGDGALQSPNNEGLQEQCDGTNGLEAHQACNKDCIIKNLSYCGDGKLQATNDEGKKEECDTNDFGNATCESLGHKGGGLLVCFEKCSINFGVCSDSKCGDGIVDKGEACDDGNRNGKPNACNIACQGPTPAICGNKELEKGEGCEIDVTELKPTEECNHCQIQVKAPLCGNKIVEGTEECDDGNFLPGDGCDSVCKKEEIVQQQPLCGNKIIEGTEECDDGNFEPGDGCNSICKKEKIAKAEPVCGNNIKEEGEGCDDGNRLGGDGCSEVCGIEQAKAITLPDQKSKIFDLEKTCTLNVNPLLDVFSSAVVYPKDYEKQIFALVGATNEGATKLGTITVKNMSQDCKFAPVFCNLNEPIQILQTASFDGNPDAFVLASDKKYFIIPKFETALATAIATSPANTCNLNLQPIEIETRRTDDNCEVAKIHAVKTTGPTVVGIVEGRCHGHGQGHNKFVGLDIFKFDLQTGSFSKQFILLNNNTDILHATVDLSKEEDPTVTLITKTRENGVEQTSVYTCNKTGENYQCLEPQTIAAMPSAFVDTRDIQDVQNWVGFREVPEGNAPTNENESKLWFTDSSQIMEFRENITVTPPTDEPASERTLPPPNPGEEGNQGNQGRQEPQPPEQGPADRLAQEERTYQIEERGSVKKEDGTAAHFDPVETAIDAYFEANGWNIILGEENSPNLKALRLNMDETGNQTTTLLEEEVYTADSPLTGISNNNEMEYVRPHALQPLLRNNFGGEGLAACFDAILRNGNKKIGTACSFFYNFNETPITKAKTTEFDGAKGRFVVDARDPMKDALEYTAHLTDQKGQNLDFWIDNIESKPEEGIVIVNFTNKGIASAGKAAKGLVISKSSQSASSDGASFPVAVSLCAKDKGNAENCASTSVAKAAQVAEIPVSDTPGATVTGDTQTPGRSGFATKVSGGGLFCSLNKNSKPQGKETFVLIVMLIVLLASYRFQIHWRGRRGSNPQPSP